MKNASRIDTTDVEQILDEKFNHLKFKFFGKYSVSTVEWSALRNICSRYVTKIQANLRTSLCYQ